MAKAYRYPGVSDTRKRKYSYYVNDTIQTKTNQWWWLRSPHSTTNFCGVVGNGTFNGGGVQYLTGMLVQYDGNLYRVIQPHNSQPNWTPDKVPALFVKISLEEYPEWVQPTGAQDAYSAGDKVSHNGKHWKSTVNGNVWEPGVYGWEEV